MKIRNKLDGRLAFGFVIVDQLFLAYVGGYGMYGDTSDCGSTDSQADLVGSRFNTETVYIGQSLVKGTKIPEYRITTA